MWTTRRWSSWRLAGLLAAALALSACAQFRTALVEKEPPGCPGYPTMARAVAIALNHADRWGIAYDPRTVDVVWLPDAWAMDIQIDQGGTGAVVTMSVALDGRLLFCQAAESCLGHEPLLRSSCPVPPEKRISGEEALRIGRLYLYRRGIITYALQPARVKRTGDPRWLVFFTGGPEKDREFMIEVSPGGKVTKFTGGI